MRGRLLKVAPVAVSVFSLVVAGLSYRETLKQNDKLNRRAVALRADLNGLAFGKSHGRACIGHMYFDVTP
jgi:hypothetical protein